jgi:hypothetical protein
MGNTLRYQKHTSPELVALFERKPYQGQHPSRAKVIVIGNDANYSPEISSDPFFEHILEYHADGVEFWKTRKVHHPFLLKSYPFDRRKHGVKYHVNFGKLHFTSAETELISFVELLNIPTIGNTGADKELFRTLFDANHLTWLESILLDGNKKFVLINQTLVRELGYISKKFGCFGWLVESISITKPPSMALKINNSLIYNGYSFSHAISNEYLNRLRTEINGYICGGK